MASAQAQKVTVPEPEYKGQVAVINTDSTTTLLQKETGEHKAKSSAFALVPIPGASLLDRTKAYLTVKGAESPNKISSKKFFPHHSCEGQQRGAKERLRYLQVRNQEEGTQIQDGRHRLRQRIGYHQFHHRGL